MFARFIKIFLVLLIVIVLLLFSLSALLPSKVSVARSVTINAPISSVHEKISNLSEWPKWNSYFIDSSKTVYTQLPGKKGFLLEDKAGRKMEFELSSVTPDTIHISLKITGKHSSDYEFVLRSIDNRRTFLIFIVNTTVGKYPWEKIQGLMLDKLMGPQYETSLERLRKYSEENATR